MNDTGHPSGWGRIPRPKFSMVPGGVMVDTMGQPHVSWPKFHLSFSEEGANLNFKKAIWTSTKSRTPIPNAYLHYKKHGHEFSVKNALDYVRKAASFIRKPNPGTLKRSEVMAALFCIILVKTFFCDDIRGGAKNFLQT